MSCTPRLLLASTSPSRRAILDATGFAYTTASPGVDEEAVVAEAKRHGPLAPREEAALLGYAKARATAAAAEPGALVLGCDSVFELDGIAYGKPHLPEVATQRWRAMSGRSGLLHTGHTLIDARTGVEASRTVTTRVDFAEVSEAQIAAYVATGEPLECAGAFTVDGHAAAFVTGIEGDFHAVVGLSPSALREMCAELGVDVASLWASADHA